MPFDVSGGGLGVEISPVSEYAFLPWRSKCVEQRLPHLLPPQTSRRVVAIGRDPG